MDSYAIVSMVHSHTSSIPSVSLPGFCLSRCQMFTAAAAYNVDPSFTFSLPDLIVFQIGQCRLPSVLWELNITANTVTIQCTVGSHVLAVLLGCLT